MTTKTTTPQPTPEPAKTRAAPVPEPETAALRAVRSVRQLNEQIARIEAKAQAAISDKADERNAIINALSPEARSIFDKFIPPAKAREAAQ